MLWAVTAMFSHEGTNLRKQVKTSKISEWKDKKSSWWCCRALALALPLSLLGYCVLLKLFEYSVIAESSVVYNLQPVPHHTLLQTVLSSVQMVLCLRARNTVLNSGRGLPQYMIGRYSERPHWMNATNVSRLLLLPGGRREQPSYKGGRWHRRDHCTASHRTWFLVLVLLLHRLCDLSPDAFSGPSSQTKTECPMILWDCSYLENNTTKWGQEMYAYQ